MALNIIKGFSLNFRSAASVFIPRCLSKRNPLHSAYEVRHLVREPACFIWDLK